MSDRKLKNNGKGTFFGNLLRGLVKTGKQLSPVFDAVTGGKVSDIVKAIGGSKELTDIEKEMLIKELEQDVIEMQEVTKRWESDMSSDSLVKQEYKTFKLSFLNYKLYLYMLY